MRLIDADSYEYPGDLKDEPTIDAVPVEIIKHYKEMWKSRAQSGHFSDRIANGMMAQAAEIMLNYHEMTKSFYGGNKEGKGCRRSMEQEGRNMSELIDREALLDECLNHYEVGNIEQNCTMDWICKTVRNFPAASPWHRVEDELPKDNTWCVFISENKHTFEQYRWIGTYSEEWGFQDDDNFMVDNVKYWMPLPEPPKEETK